MPENDVDLVNILERDTLRRWTWQRRTLGIVMLLFPLLALGFTHGWVAAIAVLVLCTVVWGWMHVCICLIFVGIELT